MTTFLLATKHLWYHTDIQGRLQNLRHFYPGMGLKLGALHNFPAIKITMVHQVHIINMSPASTVVRVWGYTNVNCHTACEDHGHIILFRLLFMRVWSAKTRRPPMLSPMADDALQRAVYEVYDLPCTSVGITQVFEKLFRNAWNLLKYLSVIVNCCGGCCKST